MKDVGILLQNCDVGAVLNSIGISYERRKSKRGYELYFKCFMTSRHSDDPEKLRMSISESGRYKGMFNCWACGEHGNLIHLLRRLGSFTFEQAVGFLENNYGSSEVAGTEGLKFRLRMFKECEERDDEIPALSFPNDYRPILSVHGASADAARSWLEDERHIDRRGMESFQIGWSSHKDLGEAIVVPIFFRGSLASIFYAQPFKGGLKRYPKNSPQGRILFNYDSCLENKRYVMVESVLDVITIWCITGLDAMACFTNMISDAQLNLLRHFDEHGVMPDLDGERGWDLVAKIVPIVGKGLWLYFVPIGKDPGDCVPSELITAIDERIRYCDYESGQFIGRMQRFTPKITSIYKK